MSSLQMRALAAYLRLTAKRRKPALDRPSRDDIRVQPVRPPGGLARRHEVSMRRIDGFDCHTVQPRGRRAVRTVVYLHGGSYTRAIAPQHWRLIAHLADAGIRVQVPHYGLAPAHTYREAYPFVTAVYRQALADDDPGRVAVVGDSAGGGLALGLAQTLGEQNLPLPERLVLISPWLDLALANPAIPKAEATDPWLTSTYLRASGRAWCGGDAPSEPRLSPINGPLAPLPVTDVYIGTRDLLYPDIQRFARQAAAAGAEVNLTVCQGAVHVYPLVPAPEGRAAARAIVQSLSC
jgi:acetyl esterase/lipase